MTPCVTLQEKLHSVKWYRIDHRGQMQEFYSYKPGNLPQAKRHLQTGIKVDVSLARFFSTLDSVLSALLKQGRSLYLPALYSDTRNCCPVLVKCSSYIGSGGQVESRRLS